MRVIQLPIRLEHVVIVLGVGDYQLLRQLDPNLLFF